MSDFRNSFSAGLVLVEGRIEAVLGAPGVAEQGHGAAPQWSGEWRALVAFQSAGRLLPEGAVICAELTARWGRLVGCTPEFAAWWLAPERTDSPAPAPEFFLEVLQ